MSLIVLSQASPRNGPSVAESNLQRLTDAARAAGCTVRAIPRNFAEVSPGEVLEGLPSGDAVFVGYFSGWPFYEALDEAAGERGVRLVNDPAASRRAMEFREFYPLIADLTPRSVFLDSAEACAEAERLGFPLFLKGGIKSLKEQGWKACIAADGEELRRKFAEGAVLARQVAPLRPCPGLRADFPASREYRVFLNGERVIGSGFYWGGRDPLGELTPKERQAIARLAQEAARRIACPLMAVDVGQVESGEWIIIEVGDLQYSGVTQISPHAFWQHLSSNIEKMY